MIRKFAIIFMLFSLCKWAVGQELQFNQWEFAPALLNPATTGLYSGTFRVGAIVKDKWGSVSSRSWKTAEGFIDAPIIRGLRANDWIGVGITYDYDLSGSSRLKQQYQRVSFAYHLGFGKKLKSSFSIGGQFANASQTVEYFTNDNGDKNLNSEQGLLGEGEPNLQNFFSQSSSMVPGKDVLDSSYKSWTVGLTYKSQVNKRNILTMGLSVAQLFNPNQAFNGVDDLPRRFIGFFQFRSQTGKKTYFEPRLVYSRQGANDKIYLRAMMGYRLKENVVLSYGAGINALTTLNVPLFVGLEYNRIKAGLSYDIDLGATTATDSYGGLEIGVSYIHIMAKKPKPKPIIICPRL